MFALFIASVINLSLPPPPEQFKNSGIGITDIVIQLKGLLYRLLMCPPQGSLCLGWRSAIIILRHITLC
jgi:hypothetical protein